MLPARHHQLRLQHTFALVVISPPFKKKIMMKFFFCYLRCISSCADSIPVRHERVPYQLAVEARELFFRRAYAFRRSYSREPVYSARFARKQRRRWQQGTQ